MKKPTLLITGGTGFIGRPLATYLAAQGYTLHLPLRSPEKFEINSPGIKIFQIQDLSAHTDWQASLEGVDIVIHLAARAHHMNDKNDDATLEKYRAANTLATEKLLAQAKQTHVKCFIFISTIKVLGEYTTHLPFDDQTEPNPHDHYALSKLDAEKLVQGSGLNYCILRLPLVYGPYPKGNLQKLSRLIDLGIPLPFLSVKNKRSFLSIEHLIEIIEKIIHQSNDIHNTYVVADNAGISLPKLLQKIAHDQHKKLRLFSCPPTVLSFLLFIIGGKKLAQRLLGSLSVHSTL